METSFKINSAEFVTSAKTFADVRLQTKNLPQVAFIGRSNVGKSSLINMLCGRKKLAVTSQTPGRTRLINFFLINERFYFVDLPGYGFAASSKTTQDDWYENIGTYLTSAKGLRLVLVMLDAQILPTEKDIMALNFLQANGLHFIILASKTDKIARSKLPSVRQKFAQSLGVGEGDIIFTSSSGNTTDNGRGEVLKKIAQVVLI